MAPGSQRDVKWADGLRGIASVLVVTAHICRSLAPYLLSPAMSQNGSPTLFQLPILRCLVMGRASVAIFALLSGYVNALKPIKQARAGTTDSALSSIAKSCFRRTGRFVMPAVVATTASWLVCQFGAYRIAKVASSSWIRDTSPEPSASFAAAFVDLYSNLLSTWVDGSNQYDRIQWTLTYLLKGSMTVYLTMLATVYVKPKYRMMIVAGLYYFKWRSGDALIGINVYAGIILAELSLDPEVQKYATDHSILCSVASSILIFTGLFFCSYPEENPEWSRWSMGLHTLGTYIFPRGSEFPRFYPGLGVDILITGIMFNTTAKTVLSHPFLCWMGKLSFPVYLLHAPLIRTVLTWVLFGGGVRPDQGKNEQGQPLPPGWLPLANRWICFLTFPLFYCFLYKVALLWSQYIDPWCGRVTQWFEDAVFQDDMKSEKPLLLS